jgi:hypothetical protein
MFSGGIISGTGWRLLAVILFFFTLQRGLFDVTCVGIANWSAMMAQWIARMHVASNMRPA